MRGAWSAKRVFVVVAMGSITIWIGDNVVGRVLGGVYENADEMPSAIRLVWQVGYYSWAAAYWPWWWLVRASQVDRWLASPWMHMLFLVVVIALSAILWATVATSAYVAIQRLRERRHASRAA